MSLIERLGRKATRRAAVNPDTWQAGTADVAPGRAFRARTLEADARITGQKVLDQMRSLPDTRLRRVSRDTVTPPETWGVPDEDNMTAGERLKITGEIGETLREVDATEASRPVHLPRQVPQNKIR